MSKVRNLPAAPESMNSQALVRVDSQIPLNPLDAQSFPSYLIQAWKASRTTSDQPQFTVFTNARSPRQAPASARTPRANRLLHVGILTRVIRTLGS